MALNLDARQRAMLAEMGVRVWWPKPVDESAGVTDRLPPEGEAAPAAPVERPPASVALASLRAEAPDRPPMAPVAAPGLGPAHADASTPTPETDGPAGPDGRGAVAALDWPALEAAVAACRACSLCERRTQTVFGVGARRARWMVIGEAPGEQEDRQGQPFVGPAGQLLDQMLAALGLSRHAAESGQPVEDDPRRPPALRAGREPVFIANVLKCRPPGNRNPLPEEMVRCEPFLRRQVALVQPQIILAAGRVAAQSLLQTNEPLTRLRGRVHHYAGVPVIVTYHPAYLLRSLPDKAKAWQDLVLALETLRGAGTLPASG